MSLFNPPLPPTPPANSFTSDVIDLIAGGSELSPTAGSVKLIMPASTKDREFHIMNYGITIVHLLFGGTIESWQEKTHSPIRLFPPSGYWYSEPFNCRLPVFAWSNDGFGKLLIGVFE